MTLEQLQQPTTDAETFFTIIAESGQRADAVRAVLAALSNREIRSILRLVDAAAASRELERARRCHR